MGTLNSRGGKLFFDFRFQGTRCREYTKFSDTTSNRKKAQKLLQRMEAEILIGTFDYAAYFPESPKVEFLEKVRKAKEAAQSGVPKFGVFAELWFQECEVGWRHSHRETVRRDLDLYLIPEFGDHYVESILKTDVLRFRAALGRMERPNGKTGLSTSRINRIIGPLKMILREAADRFDFPNQIQGIKTLKVPRSNIDPFSLQEVQKILANVRPDFRNYYTVRFLTGLRTGEIDGLKWKYVDFDRRQRSNHFGLFHIRINRNQFFADPKRFAGEPIPKSFFLHARNQFSEFWRRFFLSIKQLCRNLSQFIDLRLAFDFQLLPLFANLNGLISGRIKIAHFGLPDIQN